MPFCHCTCVLHSLQASHCPVCNELLIMHSCSRSSLSSLALCGCCSTVSAQKFAGLQSSRCLAGLRPFQPVLRASTRRCDVATDEASGFFSVPMHVDNPSTSLAWQHRSRALSARASGDPETSSQLSRRTTLAASAATAVTLLPGRLLPSQQLASHSTIYTPAMIY
jgi:hypothetical protein